MLKNINTGSANSTPTLFTEYNGKLYFRASGGTANGWTELWVTDGTEEGTMLLKDIYPGAGNSSLPGDFTVYNGKMYFSATVGVVDGGSGKELWVTDGTTAGTQLFKDIRPGGGSSNPDYFIVFNDKLYFSAIDGTHGAELWVSDGTEEGTQLLKDINVGSVGSTLRNPIVYNGKLYFGAIDGTNGRELWVSDGTEGGTEKIMPDIATSSDPLNGVNFVEAMGKLFFNANYNINGNEPWALNTDNLSNSNITLETFSLYPNPVQDVFHLKSSDVIETLTILDVSGKVVYQNNFQSNNITIDISDFKNALYIVNITTVNKVQTIRINKI